MLTRDTAPLAEKKKNTPLGPLFVLAAIFPALAIIFFARQPKEVTAAGYSAYVALTSVFAAVIFQKKAKRGAAIAALLTCIVFTGVFVVYAYLAYKL